MKKKILAFIIGLCFTIGIFHHMVIYYAHHNTHHNVEISIISHEHHNHHDIEHENETKQNTSIIIKKHLGKIKTFKDSIIIPKISFNTDFYKIISYKNLFYHHYPPYFFREIQNYSYANTIKINKSNS